MFGFVEMIKDNRVTPAFVIPSSIRADFSVLSGGEPTFCRTSKSPQTNGICERFHRTILEEFYQVAFSKKLYASLDELQTDVDQWIEHSKHLSI